MGFRAMNLEVVHDCAATVNPELAEGKPEN
jgi:hypothetical protein